MTQLMRIYDLEQAGLLREGTTMRDFTGDFEYLFGNRFGKAWFEEFGQDWPSDFVELARPVVESVDENGLKKRFSRLLKSLQTE